MIANLFKQAGLAQAAYAVFNGDADFANALKGPDGGFTATQAARFADKYALVDQFNDDAVAGVGNRTSFSVSVFTESATNKLTVALKGTLEDGDFDPTDVNIFTRGAGYDQIVAMHNWWQRESNPTGTLVRQYGIQFQASIAASPADSVKLFSGGGLASYLVPTTSVNANGSLVAALAASSGTVEVTGHSLGGHLAMAFQALNDAQTSTVTTFNAPGFKPSVANQQFFAALGGSVPSGAKTTKAHQGSTIEFVDDNCQLEA